MRVQRVEFAVADEGIHREQEERSGQYEHIHDRAREEYQERADDAYVQHERREEAPVIEVLVVERQDKREQVGFKKTLKRYQSIYSFLSQLIPFSDVNLEKLYIFNKFLTKKLPSINNPLPYTVLEDVDIDSYKIVNKGKKEFKLQIEGELKPISAGVGNYAPDVNLKLSKILKDLNDAFGTDFTEDDRVFLGRVKDNMLQNEDLLNKMEHNSKENVKAVFDKYFNQEMTKLLNSNLKLYKRIVENDKLKTKLKSDLFNLVYSEYNKKKKTLKEKEVT